MDRYRHCAKSKEQLAHDLHRAREKLIKKVVEDNLITILLFTLPELSFSTSLGSLSLRLD